MAKKNAKSGDSKLQDAAKARYEDQAAPETGSLPAILEDGAELKAQTTAPVITREEYEAMQAQHKAELTRILNIVETLQKNPTALATPAAPNIMEPTPRATCATCQQVLMNPRTKRGVCDGEHIVVRLQSTYAAFNKSFQGVVHNGVRYLGICHVPATIAHDLVSGLRRWEQKEMEKFIPGGKVFGEKGDSIYMGQSTPVI